MKKILMAISIILVVALAFALVACKDKGEANAKPESIELKATGLKNDTLTLYENAEVLVAATIRPTNAEGTVEWSTSNTSIATVNNGTVKGIAVGTTTLTAKVGDITKTINVKVEQYIPLTAINFATASMEIDTRIRKQLDFSVEPTNATVKTLIFTVEPANQGVKVSSTGIIEVESDVESGSEFTITAKGFYEQDVVATLLVTVRTYELEDIQIVDNDFHTLITSINVPLNEPYRVLFQMPVPEKAIETGAEIPTVWTSSDEDICKVNEKGRLTFYSKGTATITMEAMGITKQVEVTVGDANNDFIEEYHIPSSYIPAINAINIDDAMGWQTFADFRNGGTGAADAKKFVLEKYKYHTGPSSWFAGGGYCIEMGGWDNIHSGLEDDDMEGGGMENLFMWTKLKLSDYSSKIRAYFQYRETDATFKYKLRFTFIDPVTKEVVHLGDWMTGEFKSDPNLAAGESFVEAVIPNECKGKTVLMLLEYDDIDWTTDGLLNGVESVNIKYFTILNYDGTPIENSLWVIGNDCISEDYTGTLVQDIADGTDSTLFRDTINGSTIVSSGIGMVDHIDNGFYANNFGMFGAPQVICIQNGYNDLYAASQPDATLQFGDVGSEDKTTIYGAIRYCLDYFTTTYPTAKIIFANIPWQESMATDIETYNANLQTICGEYNNVTLLDLYTLSGINSENAIIYYIDGIHPSNQGKTLFKNLWISAINGIKEETK